MAWRKVMKMSEYKRVTVEGLHGIKATTLLDSISSSGERLTTFVVEYPRMILAELNTHRMLSRNSASSRAIPFDKMVTQLTARPVRFGEANPGMQDKGEDYNQPVFYEDADEYFSPEDYWEIAKDTAQKLAHGYHRAGYHKQIANRLTEPFQMVKTVISGTEWANFFWLRYPTFAELARVMQQAMQQSFPQTLLPGEWHLPYVTSRRNDNGKLEYWLDSETKLCEDDALKVSAARCAAVSYRNTDYGLEKCRQVHDKLVGDDRKHGSAMEHQARAMTGLDAGGEITSVTTPKTWEPGITHTDKDSNLWSGNLKGWIQYRKLIPGENYKG
jgi:hypothetical protein